MISYTTEEIKELKELFEKTKTPTKFYENKNTNFLTFMIEPEDMPEFIKQIRLAIKKLSVIQDCIHRQIKLDLGFYGSDHRKTKKQQKRLVSVSHKLDLLNSIYNKQKEVYESG